MLSKRVNLKSLLINRGRTGYIRYNQLIKLHERKNMDNRNAIGLYIPFRD